MMVSFVVVYLLFVCLVAILFSCADVCCAAFVSVCVLCVCCLFVLVCLLALLFSCC